MSKPFYEEVLARLGLVTLLDWPDNRRVYFGRPGEPSSLWLVESGLAAGQEIALEAEDAGAVHAFYGTAVAAGARAGSGTGGPLRALLGPGPRLRRQRARSRLPRRDRRAAGIRSSVISRRVENLADIVPLAGTLGIEVSKAEPDEVWAGWTGQPERCTAAGVLHGGALMAFADTLGGVCAFLNLPDGGATTATVESKTNFFRAVREGHVEGVTRPLHVGRTFIVVQTDVLDAEQRRVAQVTQTQAVLS